MSLKIALVYDRVNKFGGAERVLNVLHQQFPQAPLYTSVYDPDHAPWAKTWDVRTSFLNHMPFMRRHHEPMVMAMPYAFEQFNFSQFDLVISVTSAEAKGILTSEKTTHLCYLLTPTRYLWSHTHQYPGSSWGKSLTLPFKTKLRQWDFIAAKRPDHLIAISQTIAQRTLKYYRRQVDAVIYPPVDTKLFAHHPSRCFTSKRNYFLVVSRLVDYKNIHTVMQAFAKMPQEQLIIIGTGSLRPSLERQASKNVVFAGSVSDSELACYYHHAQALIFPQEEDFGLVAVEAMSAGVPVIAYNRGASREIIIPSISGIVYDTNDASALISAISQFHAQSWNRDEVVSSAQRFAVDVFTAKFNQFIRQL